MNESHEDWFRTLFAPEYLRHTWELYPEFRLAGINDHTQMTEEIRREIYLWAGTRSVATTKAGKEDKLYKSITDPYEIRVLEIKPGQGEERLEGSLHHCSVEFEPRDRYSAGRALSMNDLTTPISYTALSYTWGPAVYEGIFECDGRVKRITKSLECALRYLRQNDRSIVLWIDQICINQDDLDEKSQQIPLMSRIYQYASNTVIWLGEPNEHSDSAIKLLDDIHRCLQFRDEEPIQPEDFVRLCLPGPESNDWAALWGLLSRPWFTRLWIIQEVILSYLPWIVCGNSHITWAVFAKTCVQLVSTGISEWLEQRFASDPGFEKSRGDVCKRACDLVEMKEHVESWNIETGHNIFNLLVKSRGAQTFDPRDKIYGLYGICSQAKTAIPISYANDFPATELFHDVMLHHLSSTTVYWSLSLILSSVDHHSPELPSWVPDWRQPRRTTALGFSVFSETYFKANGLFLKTLMKTPTVDSQRPTDLLVRGMSFDILVTSSGLFDEPGLTPTAENKTLLDVVAFLSQLKEYPTKETLFSVFWQTIVAGKSDVDKFGCPDSFEEIVSHILDLSTGRRNSLPGQTYTARQNRPPGRGGLDHTKLESRKPGSAGDTFRKVRTAMINAVKNRRLGLTEKGYVGLFAEHLAIGDQIWILDGCNVPFLLRATGGEGRFRLIGECYVHGIMGGEAVDASSTLRDIVLV